MRMYVWFWPTLEIRQEQQVVSMWQELCGSFMQSYYLDQVCLDGKYLL